MVESDVVKAIMKEDIPQHLAEQIVSMSKLVKVKSQQKVIDVGDRNQKVFFILEGAFVSQFFDSVAETERTINFHLDDFQPFMVIPESYFRDLPSRCHLKAVHPSTILEMRKHDMQVLFEKSPDFTEVYYDKLVDILLFENDLRIRLLSQTPELLYKQLIENYPMVVRSVPSKYIAEYLGISQEWLSKLKRRL